MKISGRNHFHKPRYGALKFAFHRKIKIYTDIWIVLECLWDLYFTELAIYLAHLLLHQGRSWLTALATYGFIYLFFRIILLIFGSVKIKLTVNYISDNEKTNS